MNYGVQDLIVAFVNSLRPTADIQHELYMAGLHGFAQLQSSLLTLLGYPPVP